jgi:hypothetical protein
MIRQGKAHADITEAMAQAPAADVCRTGANSKIPPSTSLDRRAAEILDAVAVTVQASALRNSGHAVEGRSWPRAQLLASSNRDFFVKGADV